MRRCSALSSLSLRSSAVSSLFFFFLRFSSLARRTGGRGRPGPWALCSMISKLRPPAARDCGRVQISPSSCSAAITRCSSMRSRSLALRRWFTWRPEMDRSVNKTTQEQLLSNHDVKQNKIFHKLLQISWSCIRRFVAHIGCSLYLLATLKVLFTEENMKIRFVETLKGNSIHFKTLLNLTEITYTGPFR